MALHMRHGHLGVVAVHHSASDAVHHYAWTYRIACFILGPANAIVFILIAVCASTEEQVFTSHYPETVLFPCTDWRRFYAITTGHSIDICLVDVDLGE
jgi:hypothetical protein